MTSQSATAWRDVFANWPASIPKRGIVVSTLNESMPFKSFLLKGDTLMLERTNPDAMGARFILLTFDAIHLLKITDQLKESTLTEAGYVGHLAKV